MDVLMAPDYRQHNPYQQLLCDGLSELGVSVKFPKGYRRVLPLWRAVKETSPRVGVLHLHWQEAYIRRRDRFGMAVYALKLLVDLMCVKASGCRLVWTVHNELPHESSWPALHRKVQTALGWLADVVILHSQAAALQMSDRLRLPEKEIRVIPHGHVRDFYGPPIEPGEARKLLGLPVDGKIYLNFGMVRPYKGIEELLTAWAAIARDVDEGTLVIVGQPLDDEYARRLRGLAEASPRTTARFDYVQNDQVRLYFSAADFVVLPFRRALTSGSLLLALSYGVPVIAPKFAFIREIAESDYLYDPAEPQGLADSLCRAGLIAKAQFRPAVGDSTAELSWSAIASQTSRCYKVESQTATPMAVLDGR